MSIKWEDVHFGLSPVTNEIYIGKSKPMKDDSNLSVWTDKSKDVSNQCMYFVSQKLKREWEMDEEENNYVCYEYSDGSRLLWVAPGYGAEIKQIEKKDE